MKTRLKYVGLLPNQLSESFKDNFAYSSLLNRKAILYTYELISKIRHQPYYAWYFETPDKDYIFMCESQKQFQEIVLQLQLGIPIEELIHE